MKIKVNIINTQCILMSEAVTVPNLTMMTSIVSEESLARDRHNTGTHTGTSHRHTHTGTLHRHTHTGTLHRHTHTGTSHRHTHTGTLHRHTHTDFGLVYLKKRL